MGLFKKLVTLAGLGTFLYLLWRFDARLIWAETSAVGAGFLLILPFQIFDHTLNAMAWRFAFRPKDAAAVPLARLILVRMAGDGVNYLTPSGNIAGEFVRPGMIADLRPPDVTVTSVLVAKFTQALGQAFFIIGGILLLLGRLDSVSAARKAVGLGASGLIAALVLTGFVVLTNKGRLGDRIWSLAERFGPGVRENLQVFVAQHPGRLVLSIVFFMLGYAWGALEVLLICHFLSVPLDLRTALAIEVLSNVVDSVMFMVPAKIGTQEAGKTAIFAGLGLPPHQGLALGLIRHLRELIWASAGFSIYLLHQKGAFLPRLQGSPPPLPEPAAREG